ncbi:tat pathway signal sequence domain-containing protein [Asticcacaulis biprosthecium C19]|uniref:Tat pathway signal sequence domain-containing protein n=1 Tax=Asticcacaulis biprosthecium C19 TaxID=715226 RepID=F4QN44_9CAUL|nr:gluconate 2-dehydrogenase subunit 3 family protein [Asticcacaulis biprosthecium]EGF91635.1 tat pathway signal sequence domain-containing protein [Asticcacaulis biprosthecium C19]
MTTLSRRTTLAWLAAAATAIPAVPAVARSEGATAPAVARSEGATAPAGLNPQIAWPDIELPVNAALGYGTDPDLMNPIAPWPLRLSAENREAINILGNLVLPPDESGPGAGDVDIAAFVDEWISSPYEAQAGDRRKVLNGLAWLDAQSLEATGKPFAKADAATHARIVDALMLDPVPEFLVEPAGFFGRLRGLIVGGYYTLPEGKAAIGFQGNTPMKDYPGPSDEAVEHLKGLLKHLNLPYPA